MEEQQLYRRLTRLYGITVGAVLLGVFLAVGLLMEGDTRAKNRETFATLLGALSDQLYRDSSVRHSELRTLERKNSLFLHINDNGTELLYNTDDSREKKAAFAAIEALALADGYDGNAMPLTAQRRTSPTYTIREGRTTYLGAVSILPLSHGYRAITMVRRSIPLSPLKIAALAGGYAASVLLLCVAGNRLIRRALLPAVESRARQTRFIAAASHELRSPLTVISANAAMLQAAGERAGEAARVIQRESARMSRLISDMLLLASTDAQSWPVALAAVETDTVLLNAYETYAPLFRERGKELSLRLPEETLPRVTADAGRLSQVLGILMDNALSYGVSERHPMVELEAFPEGKGVCMTVSDHGPGLTGEQKERAFERFYRGDAARRDKQHFGLGLSIARELIRLQNGRLTVEDTPGGGCTFRITL